jgi:hypothetical protein
MSYCCTRDKRLSLDLLLRLKIMGTTKQIRPIDSLTMADLQEKITHTTSRSGFTNKDNDLFYFIDQQHSIHLLRKFRDYKKGEVIEVNYEDEYSSEEKHPLDLLMLRAFYEDETDEAYYCTLGVVCFCLHEHLDMSQWIKQIIRNMNRAAVYSTYTKSEKVKRIRNHVEFLYCNPNSPEEMEE